MPFKLFPENFFYKDPVFNQCGLVNLDLDNVLVQEKIR